MKTTDQHQVQRPTHAVGKLDAARRQLETAVRLYRDDGDMVPLHTLVCAAHELLANLARSRDKDHRTLKDALFEAAPPEQRDATRQRLRAAANFFKHADRDPKETLEFRPFETEIWMAEACALYTRLTGEEIQIFSAYLSWFFLVPGKDLFGSVYSRDPRYAEAAAVLVGGRTKQEFFADWLRRRS